MYRYQVKMEHVLQHLQAAPGSEGMLESELTELVGEALETKFGLRRCVVSPHPNHAAVPQTPSARRLMCDVNALRGIQADAGG